jgi:hypothetical protein
MISVLDGVDPDTRIPLARLNAISNILHLETHGSYDSAFPSSILTFTIRNNSPRAACIDVTPFNAISADLEIWDAMGRRVSLNRGADPAISVIHGFEEGNPYYILLPGRHLDLERSLHFFALTPGRFSYKIVIPYYVCRDVINLEGGAKAPDIREYDVVDSGEFTVAR